MKRMVVKLGVFLVLGAIVNLAVVWAIAYWVEYPVVVERRCGR